MSHQAGFDGDHLIVDRQSRASPHWPTRRRLFVPGHGCSYNNAAFCLAGAVIEAASGDPYATFVRERLLVPLGMSTACFTADDAITHRVAAPHAVFDAEAPMVVRGLGSQAGWELGGVEAAEGGLIASIEHLLTWATFNLYGASPGGAVELSVEARERLHTPVVDLDRTTSVALDWFVRGSGEHRTLEHPGATAGYTSWLVLVPGASAAFAVLVNDSVKAGEAIRRIRRWALERIAGIVESEPEPTAADLDMSRFEGTYAASMATLTVTRGDEPGTAHVEVSTRDDVAGWPITFPPFPFDRPAFLRFFDDDHAVDTTTPGRVIQFEPTNGRSNWMTWELRRAMRVD